MMRHSDLPKPDKQGLELASLTTEGVNPHSAELDRMTPLEIVRLMNGEDAAVAAAVGAEGEKIATAIDVIADRLRQGGRLIYLGAGTSGRLGVLDASECPPTFSTSPEMVLGLIAGGYAALTKAIEGAEDQPHAGANDLSAVKLSAGDVVVGIATSGRTPYVLGGLQYARSVGAYAIGFSCNAETALQSVSDLSIAPIVGPEILSGSTRLKAGTATKMVLNMLTTGAMVRLGKTYGNLMVDLKATNAKLKVRSRRILERLTGLDNAAAEELLNRCQGELKTAIVVQLRGCEPDAARQRLSANRGDLRSTLTEVMGSNP